VHLLIEFADRSALNIWNSGWFFTRAMLETGTGSVVGAITWIILGDPVTFLRKNLLADQGKEPPTLN